jgi:CubicO group peptidase (beta-lactamase class C family)
VQELSQTEFSQFIAERITSPLNLSASFDVPSKENQVNLATGYILSEEKLKPIKEWWAIPPLPGPEGSLKGTADDMTRWLQFHLANGTLNNVSLLHPDLIRSMHSQHFTMDPSLAGYAFAFSEYFRNKVRGIMIEVTQLPLSYHREAITGFPHCSFCYQKKNGVSFGCAIDSWKLDLPL